MFGLRLWPVLMVFLALCACTSFAQADNPVNKKMFQHDKTQSGSVDLINVQQAIVPFSLAKLKRSYHIDREDFRLNKLKGKQYGSMNNHNEFAYESGVETGTQGEVYKIYRNHRSRIRWSGFEYWVSERWQLSTDFPNIKDVSYDGSLVFIMPAPRLTYDLGSVKLSTLLYIPRIQDYNLIAVMGIYFIFSF